MYRVVIIALVCATAVLAEVDGGHSVSKRGVGKHPMFGKPVHCVTKVAQTSAEKALALYMCTKTMCDCVDGELLGSQPIITFSGGLQCIVPPVYPAFAASLTHWRGYTYNKTCEDVRICYPAYINCISANVSLACVQAVVEQCDEQVFADCSEGSVCKNGDNPGGLNAGHIFAISAGTFYFVALLLTIALCLIGRKKKQPAFEQENL
jgi:hypothetical protein